MTHCIRTFRTLGFGLLAGLLSLGPLSASAAGASSAPWPAPPPTKAAALSATISGPVIIAVSAPAAPTGVYLKGPGPNWLGLAMDSVPAAASTVRLVATPWGTGVSGLPTQQAVAPASALEIYVSGLQYSTAYQLALSSCTSSGLCSLIPDVLIANTADWPPPTGLRTTLVTMSKIQVAWDGPDPSCDWVGNCQAGSLPYSVRWMGLGGAWHTLTASGGYICPFGFSPCPGWSLQSVGFTTQLSGLAPDAPYWIEVSECIPGMTQCGRWSDPLKVRTLPIPVVSFP
jgi:hypothetical protein